MTGTRWPRIVPLALSILVGCDAEPKDSSKRTERIWSVVLTDPGDRKIATIKAVREATGLGLRAAKELVDATPSILATDLTRDGARAMVELLERAGAEGELKDR